MDTKDRFSFLVVDDHQLIIDLVRQILKNNNYKRVNSAKNGLEALHNINKASTNFIITDWGMPKMNGIELLKTLREDPKYFDMPILMLSEEMSEDKILYALEEGVDAYQQKPFSEARLINSINEVLQKKLDPDPMKYKMQKLYSMKARKKYHDAIVFAKSLLKQNKSLPIFLILGECYIENGDSEKAKKSFQHALKIKKSSKAFHLLGKVYSQEGEYEKAIKYFEEAYSINQLNTNIVIDMGQAYLQLGAMKEASETFGSLQDTSLTHLNLTNMGAAYLGTGDIAKAGKYLYQAHSPIPQTVAVFNKFAIELRKGGHIREAIEQYKKCLRIDRTNHILLYNVALAYCELKDYRDAKELLEKCLEIDPLCGEARNVLDFVKKVLNGKAAN